MDHVIGLHIKVAILQESLGISGTLEGGSVALKKFRARTCADPRLQSGGNGRHVNGSPSASELYLHFSRDY